MKDKLDKKAQPYTHLMECSVALSFEFEFGIICPCRIL